MNVRMLLSIGLLFGALAAHAEQEGDDHGPPPPLKEHRAAFKECAEAAGIKPPSESHTRPTKEQHQKMRACLAAKNIKLPDHPPGRRGDPEHGGGPGHGPRHKSPDDSSGAAPAGDDVPKGDES